MPDRRYPMAERTQLNGQEPMYWLHITDAEAKALSQGTVPEYVRETLGEMVRWQLEDPETWPTRQNPRHRRKSA